MTEFQSLPPVTETREFPLDYRRQERREVESRWVLNPVPADQAEPTGEVVVVVLTSRHDPDNKVFRSSITWETVESVPGSTYSVKKWGSDHAYLSAGRVPVARYSKKALREHHAAVLAATAEQFDRVRFVFEEAAQAVPVVEAA